MQLEVLEKVIIHGLNVKNTEELVEEMIEKLYKNLKRKKSKK